MLNEMSYKQKITLAQPWFLQIVDTVKKELKQEHLSKDRQFAKEYFAGKNLQKLTVQELAQGYHKAIDEGADHLAELIVSQWVVKHTEIYYLFETELQKINPQIEEINEIADLQALSLIDRARDEFGIENSYLFSLFNSVAFSENQLADFRAKALQELEERKREETSNTALKAMEQQQRKEQLELSRVVDKYEKKLQGLQKKYMKDTENLQKQISALQRKLQEQTV